MSLKIGCCRNIYVRVPIDTRQIFVFLAVWGLQPSEGSLPNFLIMIVSCSVQHPILRKYSGKCSLRISSSTSYTYCLRSAARILRTWLLSIVELDFVYFGFGIIDHIFAFIYTSTNVPPVYKLFYCINYIKLEKRIAHLAKRV